jgi:soluble lytic murein transglycosylase-like protein
MTIRSRSRKNRAAALGLSAALLLCAGSAHSADKNIYYYRDSKGVIHFTDAPTDARYRPFKLQARVRAGRSKFRIDPEKLKPYIDRAAGEYSLDPALIMAVIRVESAFDPHAVSWAGAQGLMQLIPGTAERMGVGDVFNISENIMGGSRYLRLMLNRFKGDTRLALAAYNAGPERVAKHNRIPKITETQNYVRRVMHYYKLYKGNV